MSTEKKFHYSILFTRTEKQDKLQKALSRAFPGNRGTVFLPKAEYWVRKTKAVETRPIFPGYVFLYTDMGTFELHEFLDSHRADVITFIKELKLYEIKNSGGSILTVSAGQDMETKSNEENEYELTDLTEEETEFLDLMLDEEYVVRMSGGYNDGGKYVIAEGPLKTVADRIVRVDRHNRIAYLNFGIRGRRAMVGLEIKPKRLYFPDDEKAPAVLEDGTEVNLLELKKRMMGR